MLPIDRPYYDRVVAAARAKLGSERFEAAWERGAAARLADVVATALEACGQQQV